MSVRTDIRHVSPSSQRTANIQCDHLNVPAPANWVPLLARGTRYLSQCIVDAGMCLLALRQHPVIFCSWTTYGSKYVLVICPQQHPAIFSSWTPSGSKFVLVISSRLAPTSYKCLLCRSGWFTACRNAAAGARGLSRAAQVDARRINAYVEGKT